MDQGGSNGLPSRWRNKSIDDLTGCLYISLLSSLESYVVCLDSSVARRGADVCFSINEIIENIAISTCKESCFVNTLIRTSHWDILEMSIYPDCLFLFVPCFIWSAVPYRSVVVY